MAGLSRWLFAPVPLARICWLRTIAYLFVPVDVLVTNRWIGRHAAVPAGLYQPLLLGRLLHLPAPGPWVVALQWILVTAAVTAATGSSPRLLGGLIAVAYLAWMLVAFSYGKVDHDRWAFLVLLAVLPTVGPAGRGRLDRSEAAGWAVQATTLALAATYLLSGVAKVRFGGWGWVTGATLSRAVVRRGTWLSAPLLGHAWALHDLQYLVLAVELLAWPLLLVRWQRPTGRWAVLGGFSLFHLLTFLTLSISFLPHCVALLALVPWEHIHERRPQVLAIPVPVPG